MSTLAAGPRRIPDDDIGHYLGFFTVVPWLLFALYLVNLLFSALVLGAPTARTPAGLAALAAVIGGLLLIVLPSRTPLPRWRTGVILAVIVFAAVAVTWQLPADVTDLGYLTWEYNPCDLLMFCLAIRARILAAWVGQVAMQLVVATWSIAQTGSPVHGLLSSYTQAFPLVACSVFAFGLHHTARQIVAHRSAERARAEQETREQTAAAALDSELQAVRAMAEPALQQIAAGGSPDPAGVRALEAALRDRVRSPSLAVEPLTSALRRVREHGVDVLVLDDLKGQALTDTQRRAAATWGAEQITHAHGATMTLRVASVNGTPHATLTVDGTSIAHEAL
ncbi:hypothetical protein [Microbacterium luticocti]|uniref:hypothetical protein n=1 Tax=Microbacterium luticocti TaxID=451764 RepID=UPI00040ED1DE|nr:hypothetical protein [Microbacterium luticocti]